MIHLWFLWQFMSKQMWLPFQQLPSCHLMHKELFKNHFHFKEQYSLSLLPLLLFFVDRCLRSLSQNSSDWPNSSGSPQGAVSSLLWSKYCKTIHLAVSPPQLGLLPLCLAMVSGRWQKEAVYIENPLPEEGSRQ